MNVVITGATGNVGTSLVERLSADPGIESIRGIARRRPSWRPPKTTWARADVTRDDLLAQFRGADAVVHLAWIFQPSHDPIATWRNNVLGSARVFDAVVGAGVGVLVYASSVGAYAPGPKDRARAVDESWPTHALPVAAYGREKSYVERLLDVLERDHPNIRVVRLRPGFIFKRESASEQQRLFAGPLAPARLARPGAIPFVPDIAGLRFQALHSSDAAEAYRLALTLPVTGAFNVAADPPVDAAALGRLLGARPVRLPAGAIRAAMAAGWWLRLLPADPRLLDLVLSLPLLDAGRARTELGWAPKRSSLDALGAFLEGLRSGAGMGTPPLRPRSGRLGTLVSGRGRPG